MWHHFNYERASEMRKKYIPVDVVVDVVDPSPEDIIADVGGGDGHYSMLFSEKCGKAIYVDPSDAAVEMMRNKVKESGKHVDIYQEDACHLEFPDHVTKVFFSNSFHDIHCRDELIEKFSGNNGKPASFILVEFKKDADIGPPADIKFSPEELDALFSRHGYKPARREFFEKHYVTRYSKD